ncbi:MAG: hypothetical protein R8N50_03795 [Alphaproteobacteria bacterium]|nr:hypothetical protein [Alphaproteobacteria bacterium]
MADKLSFGLMDIPMSCSLFMEPALKRHRHYVAPMSTFSQEYIREWNIALREVMNLPNMKTHLGQVGHKIVDGSIRSEKYLSRCVGYAPNVPMHSLHYALRFSESAKFLADKITGGSTRFFADYGAGLSPLAAATQTEHNTSNAYIIDHPVIMDAYVHTAELVGGRVPEPIQWTDVKTLALSHKLDTIVAMGVFHYMPREEQIENMRFINSYIPNFLLEIKYAVGEEPSTENAFNLQQLQGLRLLVNNAKTLETALIQNSLRYLSKFIHAMPKKREYLENVRSLFLSR